MEAVSDREAKRSADIKDSTIEISAATTARGLTIVTASNVIANCILKGGPQSTTYGINLSGATTTGNLVYGCLIYGLTAGVGINSDGAGTILINNTIYAKTGIKLNNAAASAYVAGNIVDNGSIANSIGLSRGSSSTGTWVGEYNCVGNVGSGGTAYSNITQDSTSLIAAPRFKSPTAADFSIESTSPCFRKGKPTPNGGTTNIGAWQSQGIISAFNRDNF
jgi:hypothetical protein